MKTNAGQAVEEKLWYLNDNNMRSIASVLHAAAVFKHAVAGLPASADQGRKAWPLTLGARLIEKMKHLEDRLRADERPDPAGEIRDERKDLERRLGEGRLFPPLYAVLRIEHMLRSWTDGSPAPARGDADRDRNGGHIVTGALSEEMSRLFPDRIVKQWEEEPMPGEWAEKLRQLVARQPAPARDLVRALSSVSPALGLIASRLMRAHAVLREAGREAIPAFARSAARALPWRRTVTASRLPASSSLCRSLHALHSFLIIEEKAFIIPIASPGVTIVPAPAIGFRAAGLSTITLDCAVSAPDVFAMGKNGIPKLPPILPSHSARVITSPAARRSTPRAGSSSRDRCSIPRAGTASRSSAAVKALLARVEAWRLLLETLYGAASRPAPGASREFGLLCSSLAAMAFGPESGCMAYDAGQVFGGFAFSEDDLLSAPTATVPSSGSSRRASGPRKTSMRASPVPTSGTPWRAGSGRLAASPIRRSLPWRNGGASFAEHMR